jgi:EAL domain-containing protein (putative c-di-GMP-specific phosphodiesterase class I)
VSTRQLVQHGFFRTVEEALRDARLLPKHLRLEITETALVSPHATAALLRELRDLGVKIYLDDFGTGHSSLSRLHQLPVDALKIDRSFVSSLLLPERSAIVESILALAYTLETGVVAEGVEDEVQALELDRLGCRYAQGFLFSPPMPASKVVELLESGQPIVASRRLVIENAPPAQLPWTAGAEAGVAL